MRSAQAGFTMPELLVSLAILGILALSATSAIPALRESFNRADALQQFEFDLRRCQSEATASGARVIMTLAAGGRSYTMGIDRLPYNDELVPDELIATQILPPDITAGAERIVAFNSEGYLIDSAGLLATTNFTLSERSRVFATGQIFPTGVMHSYARRGEY